MADSLTGLQQRQDDFNTYFQNTPAGTRTDLGGGNYVEMDADGYARIFDQSNHQVGAPIAPNSSVSNVAVSNPLLASKWDRQYGKMPANISSGNAAQYYGSGSFDGNHTNAAGEPLNEKGFTGQQWQQGTQQFNQKGNPDAGSYQDLGGGNFSNSQGQVMHLDNGQFVSGYANGGKSTQNAFTPVPDATRPANDLTPRATAAGPVGNLQGQPGTNQPPPRQSGYPWQPRGFPGTRAYANGGANFPAGPAANDWVSGMVNRLGNWGMPSPTARGYPPPAANFAAPLQTSLPNAPNPLSAPASMPTDNPSNSIGPSSPQSLADGLRNYDASGMYPNDRAANGGFGGRGFAAMDAMPPWMQGGNQPDWSNRGSGWTQTGTSSGGGPNWYSPNASSDAWSGDGYWNGGQDSRRPLYGYGGNAPANYPTGANTHGQPGSTYGYGYNYNYNAPDSNLYAQGGT